MSKDRYFHRTPKDSKGVLSYIAHRMSQKERIAAHESGEEHGLTTDDVESFYTRPIDQTPLDQEIVTFPQLATGYFAPEAVLQRQIQGVREQIRREVAHQPIPKAPQR